MSDSERKLSKKGFVDEVDQKYLVSGPFFLTCDQDFAQIEKCKRKCSCQVPLDLMKVIVSSKNWSSILSKYNGPSKTGPGSRSNYFSKMSLVPRNIIVFKYNGLCAITLQVLQLVFCFTASECVWHIRSQVVWNITTSFVTW